MTEVLAEPAEIPKAVAVGDERQSEMIGASLVVSTDYEPVTPQPHNGNGSVNRLTAEQTTRVMGNLGLCETVARQFHGITLTRQDLVGEGTVGLVESAIRYQPTLGPFFNFAIKRVRGGITTAVNSRDRIIRPRRKDSKSAQNVKDAIAELSDGVNRVQDADIARLTGMTEVDVRHFRFAPRIPYVESIFKTVRTLGHGGMLQLVDLLQGDADHAEPIDTAVSVNSAIDRLGGIKAGIIRYRYGIFPYSGEHTIDETAEFFGRSRDSVFRHEKRAKAILASLLSELADA